MAVDAEVGLGLVALVLLAFTGGGDEEQTDEGGPEPWIAPVPEIKPGAQTRKAKRKLCDCYKDPTKRTIQKLTLCTLRALDPSNGPTPPWQRLVNNPLPGDHPSLQKRIDKIKTWASLAIDSDGLWCAKDLNGDEEEEKKEIDPGPPMSELVDVYPTPAHFYRVQKGDYGYGIAYKYLRSAGFIAATEWGQADGLTANAFGKQVASSVAHQKTVWRWISCNGWNDATVTTYGWKSKSQPLAPTGRVVRLVPQHANNLQRLGAKQPALRTMKWGNPSWKGTGKGYSATNDHGFENLWLPGLDLKTLWDSDGTLLLVGGGDWGNSGMTKALPPPWVLKLGVTFAAGAVPDTNDFGCDGMMLRL